MKRIRYEIFNEPMEFMLRAGPFLANGIVIAITLNTNELEYNILRGGENEDIVISSGKAKSLQMLKKSAKRAAKELGVVFESEVRPRVYLTPEEEAKRDFDNDIARECNRSD